MTGDRADQGRVGQAADAAEMLASDADRDAAATRLSEAFAEGRLTTDEHAVRAREAFAARTWRQLARLTADLPGPPQMAQQPAAAGLNRCLLCALLIVCPPAGIAWLLASRRRARLLAVRPASSDHEDIYLVAAAPITHAAWQWDGRRAEDR